MGNIFYDGNKLLSLKDVNGDTPEIYICTSNRSAGKTTYFNRYAVNRFKKFGEKFALLYRFDNEMTDIDKKFFNEIKTLFFSHDEMTAERKANGAYTELFLNNNPCGYAFALNKADALKKMSHMFADTVRMIFDEFQSETNHYCPNELVKFQSVHTTVARGGGKQVRYVPVYMISNPVSLLNPYYTAFDISARLTEKVHFLRGEGWVLEQGFNENASNSQKQSAFNRAFKKSSYAEYNEMGVYLNDSKTFVENVKGKSNYLCTLKYNGKDFSIREFPEIGVLFCSKKIDPGFPMRLTVSTADHSINYVMIKRNNLFISTMRYYFEKGCFRFQDLQCKEALLKAISY